MAGKDTSSFDREGSSNDYAEDFALYLAHEQFGPKADTHKVGLRAQHMNTSTRDLYVCQNCKR